MERWVEKVAIVTGASSGIGAAIAVKLADNGLKVVGLARRADRVEELNQKVTGKGKIYSVKCDLTKEEDILSSFTWIQDNIGDVYVLVNNAGFGEGGSVLETSTEIWKQVFDVNVLSVAIYSREYLKQVAAKNISGHLISISSIAGLKAPSLLPSCAYSPSKFALQALQEVIRQELTQVKSKTKITTICPGPTESEMLELLPEHVQNSIPKMRAEDVADAVVFALSTPPEVQIQQIVMKPVGI